MSLKYPGIYATVSNFPVIKRHECESFQSTVFVIPAGIFSLSEKAFAGPLEFHKCFIIAIVQHFFLEKLPVPLDQIQIGRIRRQKYQFNLRPFDILFQQT